MISKDLYMFLQQANEYPFCVHVLKKRNQIECQYVPFSVLLG